MSFAINEIELTNKKDLNRFINIPWTIYKNDANWVPPLKMAVKDLLNVKKHPFYQTAKVKAYIAVKDGHDVGRILAINCKAYNDYYQSRTGFFGFYECINDQKISNALLDTATAFVKAEGLSEIQGPMNPGTNYECGLLVKGFDDDPQIMMTYNPKYYETLLDNYGLTKAKDLLAYEAQGGFEMPKIIKDIAERISKKDKVNLRTLNLKNWNKELDTMYEIYNSAWESNHESRLAS